MKHLLLQPKRIYLLTCMTVTLFLLLAVQTMAAPTPGPIKNIVIVHGAFADGSGFKGLYKILTRKGYHVTIVQNPLTSLKDDVDATLRTLDKQDGPTILVGHS